MGVHVCEQYIALESLGSLNPNDSADQSFPRDYYGETKSFPISNISFLRL